MELGLVWKRRLRWGVTLAAMLSAASCGYITGGFWIGEGCRDQGGSWEGGLCYTIGAHDSTPSGWQSVRAEELAAVKGVARDWGALTTSGADLDGDGLGDSISVLVDPTMTQFRVFAFFAKDGFAGATALPLTEARPIAEVEAVSVELNRPAEYSRAAASFTLRQTIDFQVGAVTYAWVNGGLVEVAS